MTHGRLAQGIIALFFSVSGLSTAGTLSGCSDDKPPTPEESHCTNRCNCEQCTTAEKGTCIDDLTNLKSDASDKSCSSEYNTYLNCMTVSSVCTDTVYDTSFCYAEETVLNDCIHPKPVCATTNNGICDEPEGTNTCAEGSDVMDCAAPCLYVGDGICNEPAPAGDGLCGPGTDTADCSGTCSTCASAFANAPPSNLCAASTTLFNNLMTCACNSCSVECTTGVDLCDGYAASTTCKNCISSLCTSQLTACNNDF